MLQYAGLAITYVRMLDLQNLDYDGPKAINVHHAHLVWNGTRDWALPPPFSLRELLHRSLNRVPSCPESRLNERRFG